MSKALKNSEEEEEVVIGGVVASPLWDCGSPLYDSFELATLSHIIDRHTVVLPHLSGSKKAISHGFDESHHHHPHHYHDEVKKISIEDSKGSSSLKSTSFGEILDKIMGKRKFLLSLAKSSNPTTLAECKQIHAKLLVTQCISQTHLANNLLSLYSKCGQFSYTHHLFDQMPHKNVITWTTLISANLRNGYLPKAFDMFNHMREVGESPNEYTLSALLRACADPGLRDVGLQLHGVLVRCGLERDKFAGSSLMYMYFNGDSDLKSACCVFHELLERDLVAWNVMVSGFAQVRGVHGLVFKFGADVDMVVGRTLVDLYAEFRDIDSCRKI
ncbi:pentatricopeptide repeat-containing protein At4g39530-like [Arachis duranensis]|uniref:Pentatricopeptide repeat-containing protein At4g39530-like n=1 Tax=Arachis duranensis TaxID=130453 RepID=A0A6P4BU92_ARADU|nr:pentatricopeptide repeat-containing protein At4g39530-like [Arachis duranensis]